MVYSYVVMKKLIVALLVLIPSLVLAQDAKFKGSVETLKQIGLGEAAAVNFGSLTLSSSNGLTLSDTNAKAALRTAIGALATNGSAAALTNFPTLNQATTNTAANVTGVVAVANGGTGVTNAGSFQAVLFPTTSTNSPTNTNAVSDAYLQVTVGTNSYLIPLFGY